MAEGKGATLQIQALSHQKSGKWKVESGKWEMGNGKWENWGIM